MTTIERDTEQGSDPERRSDVNRSESTSGQAGQAGQAQTRSAPGPGPRPHARPPETPSPLLRHSMPVLLYRIPARGGETNWGFTSETRRITGFTSEELTSAPDFWSGRIHPEDRDAAAASLEAIERRGSAILTYRWKCASGHYRWFLEQATRVHDRDGELLETTGTISDIETEVGIDRSRSFLLEELEHRVKNTLASVESLAWSTFRNTRSPDEFASSFSGRIRAMSRIHGAMNRDNWVGLSLTRLVDTALSQVREQVGDRIRISGKPIAISLHAVRPIGMALHELATNALQHGSLSVPDGRVTLTWREVESTKEKRWLVINWNESGGPPTKTSDHRGVGSMLIEEAVPFELDGEVRMIYASGGLRAEIAIPFPDPLEDIL